MYPELDAFCTDLAAAYRDEIGRLGELGCTYLQLDDTSLAYLNDPMQRARVAEIGGDPDHMHEVYIDRMNEALAGRPAGMRVTTHMCRGNFRSSWAAEGSYEFVAEVLLNDLSVDGFFMEFDDARSGGFEPLRFLPEGEARRARSGDDEARCARAERRAEATHRGGEPVRRLDQLCLSPQCGFSSTVEGNALTVDEQRAKLELVVETAREVWDT